MQSIFLRKSKPNKKKKFEYIIENWGTDLQSEHESVSS